MRRLGALVALCATVCAAGAARAENAPGITATEIKIGQTMSDTGVAAPIAGAIGKSEQAYFRMINDRGGINGRRIVLESLDDGFDPAKTLQLTRKLVEQDHVAAIFSPFATPQNMAIRGYLNQNRVPDLFVMTGDDAVINRQKYPWTIGGAPVFRIEAQIFGRYILVNMPGAKVAILRGDDLMGQSYQTGLQQGLGAQYQARIVKDISIPETTADISASWAALRASGAQALVVAAVPPIVARAIAMTHDSDWHPTIFIDFAASTPTVLLAAGLAKAKGVITANSYMDPSDPRWIESGAIQPFKDFVAKYLPGSKNDVGYFLAGYVAAQAMVQVLRQCGDDLSRDNIMFQATSLKDFHPVGLLPGITFFTSRTKYLPIVEAALTRFDGRHWIQVGEIMAGF